MSSRIVLSDRDHPRVCGEHWRTIDFEVVLKGSSPRMRGAHYMNYDGEVMEGIIPAYAGSTPPDGNGGYYRKDHPRVCWEHSF